MKSTIRSERTHSILKPLERLLAACGMKFTSGGRQRSWSDWHRMYQNNEALKTRLDLVRQTLRAVLDARPSGRIRLVSICAGDGRDVLEVVATHPRRSDIEAWLLDSDAPSVARGLTAVASLGLARPVHFRRADAAAAQSYIDIVPADILLASGFIGRLTFGELEHFAACLPAFCNAGTELIWSRHVRGNQGVDISRVRELFRMHQFDERAFAIASTNGYAVGWQRFAGTAISLDPKMRLFDSLQLEDLWSGLFSESQDSPIGRLTYDRGRWSTSYKSSSSDRKIDIHLNTTEVGPVDTEVAAITFFLGTLPEQIRTLRRSTLLGWSYYPRRITAKHNGDLAVRYRSRLRFLPSKTQLIVAPTRTGG